MQSKAVAKAPPVEVWRPEDRADSPRMHKAAGICGVTTDVLTPVPAFVFDKELFAASPLETEGIQRKKHQLRFLRCRKDCERVVDAYRLICLGPHRDMSEEMHTSMSQDPEEQEYLRNRYKARQPSSVTLGLSRSVPGFDRVVGFRKEDRRQHHLHHLSHVETKKHNIRRAATMDVEDQERKKNRVAKSKSEAAYLKSQLQERDQRQNEIKKNSAKKKDISDKRIAEVKKEWEKDGVRRLEALDDKFARSDKRVADVRAELFSKGCARDEKIAAAIKKRAENLDEFMQTTFQKYDAMDKRMKEALENKRQAEIDAIKEAGTKDKEAADKRARHAQAVMESTDAWAAKLGHRFKVELKEWEGANAKEVKAKYDKIAAAYMKRWKQYELKRREYEKEHEQLRDEVLARQEDVFERGEEALKMKQYFASSQKALEDAYRESVQVNCAKQDNAREFNRQEWCKFWKDRREQLDELESERDRVRKAQQLTQKREIQLKCETAFVKGRIVSEGYADKLHAPLLRTHGVEPGTLLPKKEAKAEEEK